MPKQSMHRTSHQEDAQVEVMVAQSEDHHHDRQDRREEGEGIERGEQASPWLGPGRHRARAGWAGR